jgi:hypothetical protein
MATEVENFIIEEELENSHSFRMIDYASEEMRHLLSLDEPELKAPDGLNNIDYVNSSVFPDWLLADNTWKNTIVNKTHNQNDISDIMQVCIPIETVFYLNHIRC